MNKRVTVLFTIIIVNILSGCITQTYEDDNHSIIEEDKSNNHDKAMIRIALGLGYLQKGELQKAKRNLDKAKFFAPKLIDVYTALAHYFEYIAEFKQAQQAYQYALTLDANNADILNNYGVYLCRRGQYKKSEQKILQAIAQPQYAFTAKSYENLALCQLTSQHYEKAELYLKKAILHSPNRKSALWQMTRLQYIKADYPRVEYYLSRYENVATYNVQVLSLAIKLYDKLALPKKKNHYLTKLLSLFPDSKAAKNYRENELFIIEADKLASNYRLWLSKRASFNKE